MATDLAATRNVGAPPTSAAADDDLGIDRDFLMMLARLPLIAAGMVLAAWARPAPFAIRARRAAVRRDDPRRRH